MLKDGRTVPQGEWVFAGQYNHERGGRDAKDDGYTVTATAKSGSVAVRGGFAAQDDGATDEGRLLTALHRWAENLPPARQPFPSSAATYRAQGPRVAMLNDGASAGPTALIRARHALPDHGFTPGEQPFVPFTSLVVHRSTP